MDVAVLSELDVTENAQPDILPSGEALSVLDCLQLRETEPVLIGLKK